MGESAVGSVLSILSAIIIFIIILYLAYITTKLLGKRYGRTGTAGKNLKIIESMPAGPDKYIMIVKAADKYILVGTGKEHIDYICDIDKDSIVFDNESGGQTKDFYSIFMEAARDKFTLKNRGDRYKSNTKSKLH